MASVVTADQVNGPLLPLITSTGSRLAAGATDNGDGTGALKVAIVSGNGAPSSTSNLSQTAQSAASVQLLAANGARKDAYIYNQQGTGTANLYVALTSNAATLNAFTFRLAPNTGMALPLDYTGAITGIWDAAGAGAAAVTELT